MKCIILKNSFINKQNGFGPLRSTLTNLLNYHWFLLKIVEFDLQIDGI